MSGPNVPVSGPEDGARCRCGHSLINHWQTGKRVCMACPEGACADYRPPVVADTTAGEAETERAARAMHEVPAQPGVYGRIPWERLTEQHRDAYRAMYRAALAARPGGAQDDGLRGRVEKLAEEWERNSLPVPEMTGRNAADRLRRALAGPDDAQQDGVCEAVNPETGRRCVRPWPHDRMHQVADGRWFGDDPRRGLPTTSRPWT